jgi:peptidoglycan hydrolase CwlO-like protein
MSLASFHPMLTVKNLLGALTAVATITLGMFVYDAERVINKVDSIETSASNLTTSVSNLTTTVNRHESQIEKMGGELSDHDKRILVLETVADESTANRGKRLDRAHLPR